MSGSSYSLIPGSITRTDPIPGVRARHDQHCVQRRRYIPAAATSHHYTPDEEKDFKIIFSDNLQF